MIQIRLELSYSNYRYHGWHSLHAQLLLFPSYHSPTKHLTESCKPRCGRRSDLIHHSTILLIMSSQVKCKKNIKKNTTCYIDFVFHRCSPQTLSRRREWWTRDPLITSHGEYFSGREIVPISIHPSSNKQSLNNDDYLVRWTRWITFLVRRIVPF